MPISASDSVLGVQVYDMLFSLLLARMIPNSTVHGLVCGSVHSAWKMPDKVLRLQNFAR